LADQQTGPLLQQFLDKDVPFGAAGEADLWQILSTIVSRSHGIVFQFVVDAVDEALRHTSGHFTIVDRLQELLALDWSGRTKLLISSRTPVGPGFRDVASIDMVNGATKTSVETFIRAKVQQAIQASRLLPQAGVEVEKRITNRARGNFLLAKLTWEQFSKGENQSTWSREQIRARLLELDTASPEFVSVYCTLLRGIPTRHGDRVRTALAILRLARTKLTSKELAYFATLCHHEVDLENTWSLFKEIKVESERFETYLLDTCGYMIKEDANGRVDFAHISARDLFSAECAQEASQEERQILSRFTIPDPESYAMLHRLCLSTFFLEDRLTWSEDYDLMLTIPPVLDGTNGANLARVAAIAAAGRTPCFIYALRFCFDHYAAASAVSDLDRKLLEFLPTDLAYWCHMFWLSLPLDPLPTFLTRHNLPADLGPPQLSRENALFRTLARVDCPRIVKTMLSDGINVNYVPTEDSANGFTLLSWTIICERPESFKVLLRHERTAVNLSVPPEAMKPLHHAAQSRDIFYIRTLIERRPDADVNARYSNLNASGTTLHVAIVSGNILGAEVLLDQPAIDIWAVDRWGDSAYLGFFRRKIWGPILKKIITTGQVARESLGLAVSNVTQYLMADIHQWTELQEEILRLVPHTVLQVDTTDGMNALVHYAYFGRKERLLWTLERIPKHNFPIREETSRHDLLHLCANQGWEDIVYLLQRRYGVRSLKSDHQGRTLLHWAMEQSWDTSRIIWADYASLLDVQDRDKQTAMHLAVIHRNQTAVELLTASGANCFLRDKRGMTPIHLAAELGFRDALHYFLDMDRREYGRTSDGASLLHLLAIWFDGSLVQKFVRMKEALLDVVDKKGRTPLHYASMAGNSSSVRQLLQLKVRVNRQDENGMTALHESIRGGAVDTAMLLLEGGADYTLSDRFGQNCLHLCLRYGAEGLLPYFLDHGVNINQLDSFGMRPLHRACGGKNATANIEKLVRGGADWEEACTPKRRSPLVIAVEAGRSDTVAAVVTWIQNSIASPRRQKHVLSRGLRVASELESTAIEQILLTAGASVDKSKIKVRRWYLPGAQPEYNRLPLVRRVSHSPEGRRSPPPDPNPGFASHRPSTGTQPDPGNSYSSYDRHQDRVYRSHAHYQAGYSYRPPPPRWAPPYPGPPG
jgi:ankyrin repeat protein